MSAASSGTRPRVGVLALQGDVREHAEALAAVGAEAVPVRRPGELAGLGGIVLPGGESTTMGRLLELTGLLEPLSAAIAAGLPTLGTCAGMVLLARELDDPATVAGSPQRLIGGLDITVQRNAFGRQVDSFEVDLALAGFASMPDDARVRGVFIRAPRVSRVGEGVSVLAEVGGFPVAVASGNIVSTAFHPESAGETALHAWLADAARHGGAGRPRAD